MNKSAPIKVLWIDDQPTEEMVALFASEGIEIEVCENYSEGIEWLKAHSNMCDAVILDVNCKETSSSEEVPSMKIFGQYRVKIISLCDSVNEMIPYFIYTGGGYAGADSLNEYTIERKEWWRSINKVYYAKPSDIGILIDDIKKASLNRTLYKYKNKYADIFNSDIGKKCESDIIEIIESVEEGTTADSSIPHKCRNVVEAICRFLQDEKIVPIKFTTNISEYSKYLGGIDDIPNYVQRHFHSLSILSNDGSHNCSMVKTSIESNEVPYLNRAMVFELFTLIVWCEKIRHDDEYRLMLQNIAAEKGEMEMMFYEDKVVVPERDENGFWHYENCSVILSCAEVGSIRLKQVTKNSNPLTKDKYPFYAKYENVTKPLNEN